MKKYQITFDSPAILSFCGICLAAMLLDAVTSQRSTVLLFSVYRAPLSDPLTWLRMLGHVFGHADWSHLLGNLMMILLVGPVAERKYGAARLCIGAAVTAVISALVQMLLFPNYMLLGASGVLFMLIILSAFPTARDNSLPLTFLLVAVLYLGQQLVQGLLRQDSVSQLTHIIGGLVGGGFGVMWRERG